VAGGASCGGGGVGVVVVVAGGGWGAGAGCSLAAGPTTQGWPSTRNPLGGQSALTTTLGAGSPSVDPAGTAPARNATPPTIAEVVTCERTTAHALDA
jgi:hypothetical protein